MEADFLFIFLSLTAPKAYLLKIKILKKVRKTKITQIVRFSSVFWIIISLLQIHIMNGIFLVTGLLH